MVIGSQMVKPIVLWASCIQIPRRSNIPTTLEALLVQDTGEHSSISEIGYAEQKYSDSCNEAKISPKILE